jgi:hypothetical protein
VTAPLARTGLLGAATSLFFTPSFILTNFSLYETFFVFFIQVIKRDEVILLAARDLSILGLYAITAVVTLTSEIIFNLHLECFHVTHHVVLLGLSCLRSSGSVKTM